MFATGRVGGVCLAAILAAMSSAAGQEQAPFPQGEAIQKDCVSHRCVLVPEKKQIKKTIYEVKEVPFCLHKLPPLHGHHHGGCCDKCAECGCVRYKRVLLKKEIVCEEICTTKCVVEEIPGCGTKAAAMPFLPPPVASEDQFPVPLPVVIR